MDAITRAAVEIQRVYRGYIVRKTMGQAHDEFREIFKELEGDIDLYECAAPSFAGPYTQGIT